MKYGWICPKCGRVNALWAPVCPCYEEMRSKWEIDYDDSCYANVVCPKCGKIMKYDFETRTYYCDCNKE